MSQSSNRTILWMVVGLAAGGLVLCCCLALTGGLAWFAFQPDVSPDYTTSYDLPQVGQEAPDFTLELLNGGQVSLSEYRGQPVFVNFWAIWCHYCIEEMPLIQDRYERYAGEMVFLVIDEGDFASDVEDFVQEQGYPFPVLLDPSYLAGDLYRIEGYPMSFFIDSDGVIRYVADGMMESADMDAGLQAIGVK